MSALKRSKAGLIRSTLLVMAASLPLFAGAGAALADPAEAVTALNVRTGPGARFHRIATLGPGEPVHIRECLRNGWCEINFRHRIGWVSGRYLDVYYEEPIYVAPPPPRRTVIIEVPEEEYYDEPDEVIVIQRSEPDVIIANPDVYDDNEPLIVTLDD
jgi:uncharacterized protein YraI